MDVFVLVTVMFSLVLMVATAEEQTCQSFFQMSGGTIIRTVDSRNRGAKYLNETKVGTKEECASLCCETNDCTVAVFEEKKPGDCYLFNCGLTDFLCKFTSHEHYVSYFMKVNRHQFDLQTWKKHANHEEELNNLRSSTPTKLSNVAPPPPPHTTSSTSSTSTTSTSSPTPPTTVVPKVTESKCTAFQFKCQGSGDCIAVYNACDGIPQCTDGSDEKPGLGCPITTTSTSKLLQNPKAEDGNSLSSLHAMQAMNNLAPPSIQNFQRDEYNQKSSGRLPQAVDPQEIFVHRDGGLIRDEAAVHYSNRAHSGVNKLGYVDQDRQPFIQYPGYPPLPPQPNREGFAYNSSPSREETSSLFRGSLPRETGSSFAPAMDRGNLTPFREESGRFHDSRVDRIPYTEQKTRYRIPEERPDPYSGPSGREGVPIYREGAPVYSETLQKDAVSYGSPEGRKSSSGYGGRGYGMEEYEYKHPHYVPEQWRPPEQSHRNTEEWKSSEVPSQRGPSGALPIDPGQVLVRDGPKKGFMPHVPHVEETQEGIKEAPRNYPNAEHRDLVAEDMKHPPVQALSKAVLTTAAPKITTSVTEVTTTKAKKIIVTESPVNKTEDTEGHVDKTASKPEKFQTDGLVDLLDGHTRKFSGAVTIVVLGCLVTFTLLLVITCRLRAVRARLRRGGLSPYAHDADYLVNGMYL